MADGPGNPERQADEQPSADLAYELQSKLFEQLATMGVAGAGLVITLKGSILSGASPIIWLAAIEFGVAAILALAANMSLIQRLLSGTASRRAQRVQLFAPLIFLGMGIGTLGTSVYLEDSPPKKAEAPQATDRPQSN